MLARFDIRRDAEGWTVFDVWTGEPVVISFTVQAGMDIQDADELADLLNYQNIHGNRLVLQ